MAGSESVNVWRRELHEALDALVAARERIEALESALNNLAGAWCHAESLDDMRGEYEAALALLTPTPKDETQ